MDADGPSPAAGPHRGHISSRATSALAAVSVVLILLYLFSRFLCQCRKHATSSGAGSTGGATATSSPSSPSRAAAACLGAGEAAPARRARGTATTTSLLPVFVRVEAAAAGRGAEKAADCAVCLAEIGVREAAGLVPGCGHVFHAECIEAWFRVNSTCPLCRAAVAAAGQGAGEAPLCSNV